MSSQIWTEKYRPVKFNEIIGQENIVKRVKSFVEQKNLPHMLFSGPAGVGKSTLALAVAKELYGGDWKSNFLELNASDDRGINVVRQTVKDFAKTKAIADMPFKIILLDECDSLTKEAQQALRRIMETYSNSCRFILSCNYISKLIDPIKSRCAIFKFKPLNREEIKVIINNIMKNENINVDERTLDYIFKASEGDVRQLTNILQSSASISKTISKEIVQEIVSESDPEIIRKIINESLNKNFIIARELLLNHMLNNGLSGLDIIKGIQQEVLNLDLTQNKKLEIIEKCGEIEFRLVEGSDEFIQLEAFLASMSK